METIKFINLFGGSQMIRLCAN